METKKVTVPDVARMKAAGERITMVTAYDCPFARLLDEAGVDLLLVGDSLGMVVQGLETTLPVTLDELVYHTRMVVRGRCRALVVGDLPFGSYQASPTQAVESAIRLVKEGGAEAVKLEGGIAMARTIEAIAAIDVPVMGHVGLTPQTATALGGYRAQGRTTENALNVARDAVALQDAGCFAIVFEAIPAAVTEVVMERIEIPVIGIGAGPAADGQVLVFHDLLGIYDGHAPRFAKRYADVKAQMVAGVAEYAAEVRGGAFPTAKHSYSIDEEELDRFRAALGPEA
jgi:3-methyl-2-oxobutanoate hydroxymethyltransferase